MTDSNEELEKPSRFIFIYALAGIIGTLVIAKVIGISYVENNDILNWVSLVIEIGVASGITVFVWKYTKYEQSKTNRVISDMKKVMEKLDEFTKEQKIQSELKEKSEHQHYKERITYELPIFVSRMDTALSQYKIDNQQGSMLANISHAKTNLIQLEQINSIFSISAEIRSQCDDLLADYRATIESIEHSCLFEKSRESTRTSMANHVKKFVQDDFFHSNNNKIIDKRLSALSTQIERISSKTK